jgi:phage recombination protein Bet
MSNEIVRHGGSALTITADQQGFNDTQLAALRQLGVDNATQADVAVFFHQAQATGLDPFKREIYLITRKGKSTIQTGIDGFYKIANRVAGGTWGIDSTLWCGQEGQWVDVWLSNQPPSAAKVTVRRGNATFTAVAVTKEYRAQGPMWDKMPSRMIAKCATALAIRQAFPDDLAGIYTTEEMPEHEPAQTRPAAAAAQQQGPAVDWHPIVDVMQQLGWDAESTKRFAQETVGHEFAKMSDLTQDEVDHVAMAMLETTNTVDAEVVDEQTGEVMPAQWSDADADADGKSFDD